MYIIDGDIMSLISKFIDIKITGYNIKRYQDKGYKCQKGDTISVYYKDLPKSDIKLLCQCDYCGEEYYVTAYDYFRRNENNTCCCGNYQCQQLKRKEKVMEKYGVDNVMKNKEILNKAKETNLIKYGCENVMQNEDIKLKFVKTMNTKYGVNYPMENSEIKKKAESTFLHKYNVRSVLSSPEIRNKIKKTLLEKYNVTSPLYINKDKLPDSKNEKYIRELYGGIPHIRIESFYPDMLIEDNIVVEYDGSGHNIKEKYMSHDEYIEKEKFRESVIIRNGYKIIRLISKSDTLPSDEDLLYIKDIGVEYLKDNFIFRYDLDKNIQIT